jgi:phenylacetate-CoA ligase
MEAIGVDVEVLPDAAADDAALKARAASVRHHIKSIIGVTCDVVAKAPGGVPRSEGKAVRVIDQR